MTYPTPAYAPCTACHDKMEHRHSADGLGSSPFQGPRIMLRFDVAGSVPTVVYEPRRGPSRIIGTFRSYEDAARDLERIAAHIRQAAATDALRGNDR